MELSQEELRALAAEKGRHLQRVFWKPGWYIYDPEAGQYDLKPNNKALFTDEETWWHLLRLSDKTLSAEARAYLLKLPNKPTI